MHSVWVNAVAFSHDGRLLASASGDGKVRLWDAGTPEQVQKLEGHSGRVNAIAFSPDGRLLASASDDETVRLWDTATEEQVQKLEGHSDWVNAVAFSPNSRLLASASYDKTVRLWDAATGEQVQKLEGYSGWVNAIAFSHDGQGLETNRGFLPLSSNSPSFLSRQPKLLENIFLDSEWITRDGQNILWLPSDYRGVCSALRGNLLIIGQRSGLVSFFEFRT